MNRGSLPRALLLASLGLEACGGNGDGAAESGAAAGGPPAAGSPPPDDKAPTGHLVGPQAGRWHAARTHQFDPGLSEDQRAAIRELENLGYLDGKHEAAGASGVLRHDPDRVAPGLNLITSAHAPAAVLADLDGRELHRWEKDIQEVWPDFPGLEKNSTFWRRTRVLGNGDLLAIYEGRGIVRLDKHSQVVWASDVRAHHDLAPNPDGTVWVLTREAHVLPEIHRRKPVLEDFVSLLGPDGRERSRVSLRAALDASDWKPDWKAILPPSGELMHANSLETLDGRLAAFDPAFQPGRFLISLRQLDLLIVVDPAEERVVWAARGEFKRQHEARVLDTGRILLFDNVGLGDASRVLEIDPAGQVLWEYRGTPEEPFFSETCGVVQRLPNGNTLVTESDYGRAFEVAPDGGIVWEYVNPERGGDQGEFIATLMEVARLPADFPTDWIPSGG